MRGLPRHIPVGLEPIADELLVVARLDLALLVAGGGPETAGVGREALVDQRDLAIDNTKLKLGVGNDDATGRCILGSSLVDLERQIANLRGDVLANDLAATLKRDILVVITDLGFVDGVNSGSGSLEASVRPSGSWMPQTVPFSS